MKKSKKEKIKVKEIVAENLSRMDKVKLEYIIDVIRPFYSFAEQDLIDKELKRKARYIRTRQQASGVPEQTDTYDNRSQ